MYLLALDQGTSSSRALLIDRQRRVVAVHNVAFDCDYPQPGWVEVSAERIWGSQREAIGAVLQKAAIGPAQVHAIGLTNQRETVIAWRRSTGQALLSGLGTWGRLQGPGTRKTRDASSCTIALDIQRSGRRV